MNKPFRLYYWFKGALENRAGGPWWAKDFVGVEERKLFFHDIKSFLYAWSFDLAIEPLITQTILPNTENITYAKEKISI